MTQYTTEDFQRWGKIGGNLHKKTKGADYFSQIASMRKNPGRKRLKKIISTLSRNDVRKQEESNRANKRNEIL